MHKNLAQLEHKIGERTYKFLCDVDAPLGEIHDALCKFRGYVIDVMQAADKPKEELQKGQNNEQCSSCND